MAESLSKIRDYRNRIGMTTTELGAAVGLTSASISRIEAGKQNITVDNLNKIALALGVRLIDLLDEGGQKVAYAAVLGAIGAPLYDPSRTWTIPVPLPEGRDYAAFETKVGFYVGTSQRPDVEKYGRPFLINVVGGGWLPSPSTALLLSTFQRSASGPGFQVEADDPGKRWIVLGDSRILATYRLLVEIKYYDERPTFSPLSRLPGIRDLSQD